MKTYARIDNGIVAELFSTDGDITEMFHPDLIWVEIPDEAVAVGWAFAAGKFTAPVIPAPTAEELKAMIAARRFEAETAGITLYGSAIDTGRDSQALITGAAMAAMLDPNYSCQWKTAGGFIELTAPQLLAIATAMRAHVQACFDREAQLLAALEAGSFTEAMLDEGWPE